MRTALALVNQLLRRLPDHFGTDSLPFEGARSASSGELRVRTV